MQLTTDQGDAYLYFNLDNHVSEAYLNVDRLVQSQLVELDVLLAADPEEHNNVGRLGADCWARNKSRRPWMAHNQHKPTQNI